MGSCRESLSCLQRSKAIRTTRLPDKAEAGSGRALDCARTLATERVQRAVICELTDRVGATI